MLAKRYRAKKFVIAAQDEATFGMIPSVSRGWAKKGSRTTAPRNYSYKWRNVFGARSKKAFVFSFHKKKNQVTYVSFLQKLIDRWGKVLLFIDNAPWHKGPIVHRFLRKKRKVLRIERFPKYCPELNPVEPCWKPARKKIGNIMVSSIGAMEYHLKKVFGNLSLLPKMFNYLSN